jgi:hypothetical protein
VARNSFAADDSRHKFRQCHRIVIGREVALIPRTNKALAKLLLVPDLVLEVIRKAANSVQKSQVA